MTSAEGPPPQRVRQEAAADGSGEAYQAGRDLHRTTHVHEAPAPVRPTVIRGLRRDTLYFTGRDEELRLLLGAIASGEVRIHTINGMPGVGKTALVTRAAHLLAGQFPDGQFFVDLRAHAQGQAPADPVDVLATLLAGLGMDPRSLPTSLDGRSGLWRDQLAGRRVLLVLDDAADSDQIESLLPGGPSCLTLVTSRSRLVDLDGGKPWSLGTLPHDEAMTLFGRLAHRGTRGAPHDAAADHAVGIGEGDTEVLDNIVELCGRLPLAIVLLAGRLSHRPTWTLADLAADFTATTDRLDHLVARKRAVSAAFALSYQDLPPGRRRLFRRLGLHPGPDIDLRAAAALDGISDAEARDGLEALYTDHLLEEMAPRRYSLHGLLREFAAHRSACEETADDCDRALGRLVEYYRSTAEQAERVIWARGPVCPGLPDAGSALNWLRTERANVLACLDHAADHEQREQVVGLTAALAPFLLREGPWSQAVALHERAVAAARATGDPHSEAHALVELGFIRYATGDFAVSTDFHERALALFEELGDRSGQAQALHGLGRVRATADDYAAASGFHARALALFQELGDRHGQANALHGLGRVRYMTADYTASTELSGRALALFDAVGDRCGQGSTLLCLGFVRYLTGEYEAATGFQERALALFEELGDRHGQANALQDLGRVRFVMGDYVAAAALHERALELFEELGDRHGRANGLNNLGRARFVMGDYVAAAALHERALELFVQLGDRHGRANGLNNLGRVRYAAGDNEGAADLHRQALELFEEIGSPHGRCNALHDLGRTHYSAGAYATAADLYEQALHLFQQVGDPQGEAEVWNSVGALRTAATGAAESLTAYRKALELARLVGSPLDEATALEGAARSQLLTGDAEAAMADLRQAARLYDRIGAKAATTEGRRTARD
ncbi:tetratricopeptide repeat protein [Streptomyces atriruber]|uniref:tetratricopeptide repeat protein n=1 Tax=Streptomyces atriruber TaxID=545121 RepID=UPI00099E1CF6|nr:tetratricopeptide repeat protein [Streptomyces atriruber]